MLYHKRDNVVCEPALSHTVKSDPPGLLARPHDKMLHWGMLHHRCCLVFLLSRVSLLTSDAH